MRWGTAAITTGSSPSSDSIEPAGAGGRTEAAVLVAIGQPLRLVELNVPRLGPGQILVDIAYSGVCHSQLNEVRGVRGPDPFLPHTLGHEGSGTVVGVGAGVTKVKVGDHVVLSWIRGAGADIRSTVYRGPDGCVNSGAISTFMRRAVVAENRVTPIPARMPLREAALLGCAIPTGAGIVLNTMKVSAGASLAIFGIGGIGASALLAASLAQASPIVAVDVVKDKLGFARALGATHAIDARREDPAEAIRALTGGAGVDFAVEAAGRRESMEIAFRSVRDGGGLLVIAGNLPRGETISIDPFDLIRGKRIVGTWGGEADPDRDVPRFVEWYLAGRLPLERLIGPSYALGDINRAMADLEQGRVVRGLIDMGAS